jgi:hypothetical protein
MHKLLATVRRLRIKTGTTVELILLFILETYPVLRRGYGRMFHDAS